MKTMELRYDDAIDAFVDHRAALDRLLGNFQNDYDGDQPELIKALADKIEHICIYLGSPCSIKPMLRSIVTLKLKRWIRGGWDGPSFNKAMYTLKEHKKYNKSSWRYRTDTYQPQAPPWMHKGEITRRWGEFSEKKEVRVNHKTGEEYKVWVKTGIKDKGFITGHFRWNFKAYICNYNTSNYIKNFFQL